VQYGKKNYVSSKELAKVAAVSFAIMTIIAPVYYIFQQVLAQPYLSTANVNPYGIYPHNVCALMPYYCTYPPYPYPSPYPYVYPYPYPYP
jgi:Na+-driven multidrug efflux pump